MPVLTDTLVIAIKSTIELHTVIVVSFCNFVKVYYNIFLSFHIQIVGMCLKCITKYGIICFVSERDAKLLQKKGVMRTVNL